MLMCKVEYVDLSDRETKYGRPWVHYDPKSDFLTMRVDEI